VLSDDADISGDALRQGLKQSLPDYMVPAAIVRLDSWPLTPNGKIDKKALPAPEYQDSDRYVAPRTNIERALCDIWKELLVVKQVSIHDDFFAIGGHSLLAAQLSLRIRKDLDAEVSLKTLFEATTVAELAELIEPPTEPSDTRVLSNEASIPALVRLPGIESTRIPLTYTQMVYWLIYYSTRETENNGWPVLINGALDIPVLNEALNQLINYHEALRSSIKLLKPMQTIKQTKPYKLVFYDYEHMKKTSKKELFAKISKVFDEPFDLASPPLIRGMLIRLEEKKHMLVVVFPHILMDGGGLQIFTRHIEQVYKALLKNKPFPLSPEAIRISDFIDWERRINKQAFKKSTRFWESALNNVSHPRFPDTCLTEARSSRIRQIEITDDCLQRLEALSRRHKASLQMTLMTMVGVGIHLTTHQKEFCLTSVLENRDHEELNNLIAPVYNLMMTPVHILFSRSFVDHLKLIREHSLYAYEHRHCPQTKVLALAAKALWKKTPKTYVFGLRMIGRIIDLIYMKAALYPGLFFDAFLLEASPPEFNWRNPFRKRKKNFIRNPMVAVNILQSFYKSDSSAVSEQSSSWKVMDELSSHFGLPRQSKLLAMESSPDKSNFDGDIGIFFEKTKDGKRHMYISCRCLNRQGLDQLTENLNTAMKMATDYPHHSLKVLINRSKELEE
jgi:acyl carrier protein